VPVYKKVNEKFFDLWSPEMAYVLGFIFADGYVHTNKRGGAYLGFVSTDREIIEKIRKVLGSNHKVGIRNRNGMKQHWKDSYRLQIGNQRILQKLEKFGIIQNKSLTVAMPKNIPPDLLSHFVRGYFDGDGCVYFKKHKSKDRKNPRWVFQCRFISGSRKFIEGLYVLLKKFTKGGFIVNKTHNSGFELCYSHRDSLALYNLMYNNASVKELFLERKYRLFTKAVVTLYGRIENTRS